LRLSSVFFLPWAYFLSRYGRTLFQVQFHFILITALFLGLLNGIIFLGNKVEYLYFIGLHMGCVGAMVLIPWEKKFIFCVPTVIYIPYLFSAVSMLSSREDVDFVVASFANGLGLIVLLYIVWNYSEKLRRGELHARFSLINEV